jgi:cysteinyl-tRNA synthetase
MNDDFDTPSAIRALEKLAAAGARESDLTRRRALLASLQSAFDILGIGVVGSE